MISTFTRLGGEVGHARRLLVAGFSITHLFRGTTRYPAGASVLELHFLHARRDELRDVGQAGEQQLVLELRRSAARFDQVGLDVGFLQSWAKHVA